MTSRPQGGLKVIGTDSEPGASGCTMVALAINPRYGGIPRSTSNGYDKVELNSQGKTSISSSMFLISVPAYDRQYKHSSTRK